MAEATAFKTGIPAYRTTPPWPTADLRESQLDTDVLAQKIGAIELLDGIVAAASVFVLLFVGCVGRRIADRPKRKRNEKKKKKKNEREK